MSQESEIRAALKAWRDGLVGLTRSNRLIKFNAPRSSSLLIDSPTSDELFELVHSGKSLVFRGEVASAEEPSDEQSANLVDEPFAIQMSATDVLHSPRPDKELGPVLRNLMRKAQAEYLDRGLSVLYLAFGMLHWTEIDNTKMVSPLLLVPVMLEPQGPRGTPRLRLGEDDAVMNPALTLRLKEFNIQLPAADVAEDRSVSELLDIVGKALEVNREFGNWEICDATHLSTFSFTKEAMYKDLEDNEARVLENPIVRALGTSDPTLQTSEFQFDAIDAEDIDEAAPPEGTPLVLDADSSQRAAIAAALAGKTFVMDGPPGTGKSQTIANMIGALLHAGKTVLFVSEKIAALEVVRNRLVDAGLGSYLLELHSHKASRKEVAAELLRTLDNVAVPPTAMEALTRAQVKGTREKLNAYAAAMNTVRQPLNMSLHEVIGKLSLLSEVPSAPVSDVRVTELSQEDYASVTESAKSLARAWRPASQGNSFLWRDIVDQTSLDIRLYQAETALEELRGTAELTRAAGDAFGLRAPSDSPKIARLLELWHDARSRAALTGWLTADSLAPIAEAREALGQRISEIAAADHAFHSATGASWAALGDPEQIPAAPTVGVLQPAPVDIRVLKSGDLRATADSFEALAAKLRETKDSLCGIAQALGLEPVDSYADVDRVLSLVELRSRNTAPEMRWFSPASLEEARLAANELRELDRMLTSAENEASRTFTPEALSAPVAELSDRFANLHKGLRKLSAGYRTDKKAVASLLHEASAVKEGIAHLSDAIRWRDADAAYQSASITRGEVLGAHWRGRDTDFAAIAEALDVVEEALLLAGGPVPTALVTYLKNPASDDAYASIAAEAKRFLEAWRSSLAPAPALAGRPELLTRTLDDGIDWLTAQIQPMRQALERVHAVDAAIGGDRNLDEIDDVLRLHAIALQAHARMAGAAPSFHQQFGTYFAGEASDLPSLDSALAWVSDMRNLAGGPLDEAKIGALNESPVLETLVPAFDRWAAVADRVVAAFSPARQAEIRDELDDYGRASELLGELRADTVGQQEWFDYTRARAALAQQGLETAVDFCVQQRIDASDVPDVLDKSLLRAWADAVTYSDSSVRPLAWADRQALVEEYRQLDRQLVVAATSEIVRSANLRRPVNTTIGEPAVIRREGAKQKRHMPVRDLIAKTSTTTTAIKPVFMMSPLAVSQYVPSDMTFDVVIFDEASQVTPGDAINCVYRGRSLILAGDDKQLPPTSFFERSTEDDEDIDTDVKDFQSILELAKAAGAFNNLGLRWHYRSRHEDLIAFSNYKFYEGKLITYPSAHVEGADVGIAFYNTHGTYRRGGGAYNPAEATKVAERVLEHFTTRPELSVGVVTFSVAQADAVIDALDDARQTRRELDRFFDTNDRLGGFFVRSLESVQGDERDVIIFSIGYGPDEAGKISTNFGVLNKDKGWRRLNVGITRARQRVEVIASMRAQDIPPSTNENVEYLRAYLDYAERGAEALAATFSSTGLAPESPFEESVIAVLRGWGYTVEPQVGAAGFRIDMAVRHPAKPGMFAIGIECDGFQYHSAPAARDRDRLREQILTGLGWRLHRIWGTAWYRDRATEESRLRAAVDAAIADTARDSDSTSARIDRPTVEIVGAAESSVPGWTTEYSKAGPVYLPRWADPGARGSHFYMVNAIKALAESEGPVHLDVVFDRVREWWSIGRVGSNIRANLERAIAASGVAFADEFIDVSNRPIGWVRVPSYNFSRKVEHVHPGELGLAAALLVRDVGAARRDEVVQQIARIFGWARTGAIVERRINAAIDSAIEHGQMIDDVGVLRDLEPSE